MLVHKKIIILLFFIIDLNATDMGFTLFQGNCVTCHHPTKSISAPSMQIIKKRYKDIFKTKKEFIEYMSVWVTNPKVESSLMDDMIKKYKLMPQLAFTLDTTTDIANYIYSTDFSK